MDNITQELIDKLSLVHSQASEQTKVLVSINEKLERIVAALPKDLPSGPPKVVDLNDV